MLWLRHGLWIRRAPRAFALGWGPLTIVAWGNWRC